MPKIGKSIDMLNLWLPRARGGIRERLPVGMGLFECNESVLEQNVMVVAPLVRILNTTELYILYEWYGIGIISQKCFYKKGIKNKAGNIFICQHFFFLTF